MIPDADDFARREAARPSRAARLIAGALTPANVITGLLVFVAWRHTPDGYHAAALTVLTIALVVGLPYLILFRALRLGRADDRQVVRRSQRPALMVAALGCVVGALAALTYLGAPQELVALVVAMAGGLAAMTLITLRSKASMHMAVAAGAVAIAILETPAGWLTLLLLPPIAWARWRDGRHSPGQLATGALVGALAAASIYAALA